MGNRIVATRPHMPGYGISEDVHGVKPWSWAEEILRAGHNYWLATARGDGRPHAMPVWAVWEANALWISTGEQSRKTRNLRSRPECSVSTERGPHAVIVEGVASALSFSQVQSSIPRAYLAKYGMGLPEDSPVFRIDPSVVFGFSEVHEEFSADATRWRFERG
ncbi:MAG: pyridoxamine 5'-phosphate oxidase family protein [Deltaproteobacteria bacterium]|nr:pyridoxamine 5'-phosphate oxidase family protein [Deltaproteobacteria bacterium]